MKHFLLIAGILLTIALCIASCGGGTNSTSKQIDEANSTSKQIDEANSTSKQIDEEAAILKHWRKVNNEISITSENYYVTEKGENIYGSILCGRDKRILPDGKYGGFSLDVYGFDEKQPKTNVYLDKNDTSFFVSFNDEDVISWPYYTQPFENTVVIAYSGEWEDHLRNSETCEIIVNTEIGKMEFRFNIKGFPW